MAKLVYIYPTNESIDWESGSKSPHTAIDSQWADVWRSEMQADRPHETLVIEDCPEFNIDLGGSVTGTEPVVSVEAGGVTFTAYLRQIDYIINRLEKDSRTESGCLPVHACVKGAWNQLVVTRETADELIKRLRAELDTRGGEFETAQRELEEGLKKAGVVRVVGS